MHNRIFGQPEPIIGDRRVSFVDVSSISFASAFPFRTYASRNLLNRYTIAGIADDDEGRLFVEGILGDIFAAITGAMPAVSVSYGRSFAITFEFVAQHRQRPMPAVLKLRALFSPCDTDPEVYVSMVPEYGSSGDAPEESAAF
jgi:hypothetical protein